jgi:hypothetical protein
MMDLGPRFDEATLRSWKTAADTLNRIEGEHRIEFLVRRVKMRPVMWRADFWKHADDDSKEPRDFRHGVLYIVVVDRVGLTVRMSRAPHDRLARRLHSRVSPRCSAT